MCGCRGGNKKSNNASKQNFKANLQSPRKPFVQPPSLQPPPQQNQFMLQPPQQPSISQPISAADRRRIQRLNQEAIRRSLNK